MIVGNNGKFFTPSNAMSSRLFIRYTDRITRGLKSNSCVCNFPRHFKKGVNSGTIKIIKSAHERAGMVTLNGQFVVI